MNRYEYNSNTKIKRSIRQTIGIRGQRWTLKLDPQYSIHLVNIDEEKAKQLNTNAIIWRVTYSPYGQYTHEWDWLLKEAYDMTEQSHILKELS